MIGNSRLHSLLLELSRTFITIKQVGCDDRLMRDVCAS
jgi:hypothetical protein